MKGSEVGGDEEEASFGFPAKQVCLLFRAESAYIFLRVLIFDGFVGGEAWVKSAEQKFVVGVKVTGE